MRYDVVIVGASIAGCSAAIRYGRAGLHVALLDRHDLLSAHKTLCSHILMAGAQAPLQRLGLWDPILQAGGTRSALTAWSSAGWIRPPDGDEGTCVSLPRRILDPLMRRTAADTPGVDLLLGRTAVGVLRTGRAVTGVRTRSARTGTEEFTGRLVVAADGYRSPVADLAGVPCHTAPNNRFMFWATYTGAEAAKAGTAQMWMQDPDVAVAVPTSDGRLMVGAFPAKARLPEFRTDRAAAIERTVSTLPHAPDLTGAQRCSGVVGTVDYACRRRDPTPLPGLALIGDAALTTDPLQASGCSWAIRSAEWLTDATTPALLTGDHLTAALQRYRRDHRLLRQYYRYHVRDALARPANPVQRLVRSAAVHDPDIARAMYRFGTQTMAAHGLLSPRFLHRCHQAVRARGRTFP